MECLPAFCKVLNDVAHNALNIIASVGRAWTEFEVSRATSFSPLLMASLSVVDGSPAFSSLVVQVTSRCLLFQRNPMPLAFLIQYVCKQEDRLIAMKSKAGVPLFEYAKALVDFDHASGSKRLELLGKMLRSCFSPGNKWLAAYSWLRQSPSAAAENVDDWFEIPQTFEKSLAFTKFLIHVQLISNDTEMVPDRCWALLRRTVPTMLLVRSRKVILFRPRKLSIDCLLTNIDFSNFPLKSQITEVLSFSKIATPFRDKSHAIISKC
jgi:hypothetical protein